MRISDCSSDVCSSDICLRLLSSCWAIFPQTSMALQLSMDPAQKPSPMRSQRVAVNQLIGLIQLADPSVENMPTSAWPTGFRSEEHTSELQSLMRTPYAVLCLTNKTPNDTRLQT